MAEDIKKPVESSNEEQMQKPAKKKNASSGVLAKIILILIVVVVILGALYFVDKYTDVNIFGMDSGDEVTVTDWQAVFLSNGQVYFGKIASYNSRFLVLEDIYYLQVVQRPLQATQTGETVQNQQQTQNELSLVKLGNELHGPEDRMMINSEQVLFTEKLRSNSNVVDAIQRYMDEQAAQ